MKTGPDDTDRYPSTAAASEESGTYLGLDLGTSSVKLLLTDSRGRVLGQASADYPMHGRSQGFYEQRPEEWLDAIRHAAAKLRAGGTREGSDFPEAAAAGTPRGSEDGDLAAAKGDFPSADMESAWRNIRRIGLSAQMPTLVLLSREARREGQKEGQKEERNSSGQGGDGARRAGDSRPGGVAQVCADGQSSDGAWISNCSRPGDSAQFSGGSQFGAGAGVLGNAIVWCDNRAAEEGRRLLELWGDRRHYAVTGVFLDGRYLAPMYLWIRRHRPELVEKPHWILSAKDYLYFWLSGQICTDPSTASGYGLYDLRGNCWNEELCREADINMELLPCLRDSFDSSALIRRETAEALGLSWDVKIVCGGADSVAGVYGMGGTEQGTICQICGSSTAIVAVGSADAAGTAVGSADAAGIGGSTDEDRRDGCETGGGAGGSKADSGAGGDEDATAADQGAGQFFFTPLLNSGAVGMEADILSTGNTMGWLLDLLNEMRGRKDLTYQDLSRLAGEAPAGSDGLYFMPYLAGGEQGVLWDDRLTGGFAGLKLSHRLCHMARACYEGIVFEGRRCVEAFCAGGLQPRKVIMTGPVTGDPVFMQMTADVLGLPCTASEVNNASAYGAALLALGAPGKAASGADGRVYIPDPKIQVVYNQCYSSYIKVSKSVLKERR